MATWKKVVRFEAYYEVNEVGHIRRTAPAHGAKVGRVRKAHRLKGRGYMKIWLFGDKGHKKCVSVHTVVCEAFHGSRPDGMQVNHKNGVQDDNRAENLEWVTPSQNTQHRFDVLGQHNLHGESHPNSKLTEENVQLIRTLAKLGCTWRGVAEQIGVSKSSVMMIMTGRNWSWLPFVEIKPLPPGYAVVSESEMRSRGYKKRKSN